MGQKGRSQENTAADYHHPYLAKNPDGYCRAEDLCRCWMQPLLAIHKLFVRVGLKRARQIQCRVRK
jgi:hypothetical protein